jgi:menaquinone-dependent protoporphyrinogen oxidase
MEVTTVRNINIFGAVVLGSAVYMGNWQLQATNFLKKFEPELSQRPVWLFSSGPTGGGNPKGIMEGWEFPEQLKPYKDQIKPREIAFFHGKLDVEELNLLERSTVKLIRAPLGDYRDWDMIDEWAVEIGEFLQYESSEIASGV